MSVNYIDKSTGDLIRVAGQGKAEYGASTVRKGTFTGTDNGTGLINITVTFDSPMPDADYLVDITDVSSVENFWVSVAAKTKNGFALYLRKSTGGSSITVNGIYTAFKLYTDTEYNNLLDLPDRVEAVEEAMAVTTGTGTRNATYVKSDSFTATWTKIGHLVTAEVQFNLSQATLSTEELITGFPKPVCPVAVVAQGEANDAAYGLVLRTNGSIRTHYQGVADQFYHATITYITAD